MANITNQASQTHSNQESSRKSLSKSLNKSETKSITHNRGKEHSQTKSLTKTLSTILSSTTTATHTRSGSWTVTINLIPYLIKELRQDGWNQMAFNLTNSDVGTSFFVNGDDDIINLNKKAYYEAQAASHGVLSQSQTNRLKSIITLLYQTGTLISKASDYMQQFNSPTITNIQKIADFAIVKSYKILQKQKPRIVIHECNYGGNNNIYNCDDSQYTVMLTGSIPTLLVDGTPYYSADKIGYATRTLTINFAVNNNQAMSRLIQNSRSRSVALAIRQYTSYLQQHGQSQVAQQIKTAMIEKALTSNLSTSASAVIRAIDSGSPINVLNIFK